MRSYMLPICPFLLGLMTADTNKIPIGKLLDEMIHRSTLTEPGGRPFYLKASIIDRDDSKSEFNGTVEEYWVSPTKWRRVIKLRDFSQTRIVNGGAIYEDNSGDYFPLHDEMLANEIVDPLPKAAVDLLKKLDMEATEPGSKEGQCMAEEHFKDGDGYDTRVLLAYNCKSGLLIYLWSPSCCYGVMTDYRKFHDKLVAFATKDDPVNIRIDTLRDLDAPEEALFTISQPTPPAKRIITKRASETEARKLTALGGDMKKMEITIDVLETAPNVGDSILQIPGVQPLFTAEEEDHRFTQPRAVYTVKPSIPGWHGKLMCQIKIDEHGHVRDVDVKGTTDESVIKSIRAALMNWEYDPATMNGHPVLGFAQVNVE